MFRITKDSSSGSFIQFLAKKHVGVISNILKYFIVILILSTNYIFVHLLGNEVF